MAQQLNIFYKKQIREAKRLVEKAKEIVQDAWNNHDDRDFNEAVKGCDLAITELDKQLNEGQ